MKTPNSLSWPLDGIYLFEALDDKQRERMRQSARLISVMNGEHLFEQGQQAERFYLVRKGQITLKRVSPEGAEKIIEIIYPGRTFAEAVTFMGQHMYPVSAVSVGASEVLSFSNRDYRSILKDSNESCFRLMADMSHRLHRLINEIDHLTMQTGTSRVVSYLCYQISEDAIAPVDIHLSTPKSMIASLLSIKPETFSRTLHELSEQGIISVKKKTIRIKDLDALRELGTLDAKK